MRVARLTLLVREGDSALQQMKHLRAHTPVHRLRDPSIAHLPCLSKLTLQDECAGSVVR